MKDGVGAVFGLSGKDKMLSKMKRKLSRPKAMASSALMVRP